MTNQVNQAFEKWFESQYNHKPKENNGVYMTMFADGASKGYQDATQASESEINSLRQRVEALQADNFRLREALERIVKAEDNVYNCEDDYQGDVIGKLSDIHFKAYNKARKVLSSTPAQSLAYHDNETIERIATMLENAEGELKTLSEYIALVRKMKHE